MQHFERCKEERLCKDKSGDAFAALVSSETSLEPEMIVSKAFFLDFLSYVVAMQIRYTTP